jgi:hypothetical protein
VRESYGVFQCGKCGRVNVDGEPIPDGASEPIGVIRTSAASFVAPPAGTSLPTRTRPPLPRVLFAFIIIEAVLSVWAAFAFGGSILRLILRITVFAGLLTAHPGAYRYAVGGMMVSLVFGGILVMSLWAGAPTMARAFLVLLLGIDVTFFVALLSDDARKHFAST